MNERIKKLLAQAHLDCGPDTNKVAERYAELIVRECADIADNQEDYLTAKIIKQQFGVEE